VAHVRIILPPVAPFGPQASSIHERLCCIALDGIGSYPILNTWHYPDVGIAAIVGIVGAMRHKLDVVATVKYVCITGSDAIQLVAVV
jgi:hypothetical protein